MSKDVLEQKITEGLKDLSSWEGRQITIGHLRPGIVKTVAAHPELREQLRKIKQESIGRLEQLLPQAVCAMEKNGFHVYLANSNEAAAAHIAALVNGANKVVKSKTNTGKEIDITKRLQQQGAEVYETDLGDRLAQLEGKGKSAHTLAPAAHLTKEDCAALLSRDIGEALPAEAVALVAAARKRLRGVFMEAQVGISGANAIAAENGAVFLTENEGNIRCATSLPQKHIIIAGIEKIVPRFSDGLTVMKSASSFGCGQDIGTYVSIIDGVSHFHAPSMAFLHGAQGPQEVHVVLLTQGRREAIAQGYEEVLYCINCGGCLNTCPVYHAIGDKFGDKYLGGRGTVFAAFHSSDADKHKEAGLSLCIGCQRCLESCPAEIAVPEMILQLRRQDVCNHGEGIVKGSVFQMLANRQLAPLTKLARHLQGAALEAQGNDSATLRIGLEWMGMPKERLLPQLAAKSLAERIGKRAPLAVPRHTVALFAGCMTNYIDTQLGVDVYDILMANQVRMLHYADEACCGLPAIMSGDTEQAKRMAVANIRLFAKEEYDFLIFICPSCATTVKDQWARLLEHEKDSSLQRAYQNMLSKVMDFNDYLVNVLHIQPPKLKEAVHVTYHDPCHLARGLQVRKEPRQLLQQIGAKLTEMQEPDSCCGFGGSFSLFHYPVSRRINEEKITHIANTGAQLAITSCPGCVLHLNDGFYHAYSQQKAIHIAHLLAQAYRQGV